MKAYDFEAVTYDGAVYCTACLPEGISSDSDEVSPIFADSEWDSYPCCDKCHGIHDYVSLTDHGRQEKADRALESALESCSELDNEVRLVSALMHGTIKVPIYDDGFGYLWIHRNSMGASGIVRAETWEDAYSICEDEFFPAGDEDAAEDYRLLEAMPEDSEERKHAQDCWDEAYGYRGNGRKESDGTVSSIYAKDLNGDSLELLGAELCTALSLVLSVEHE